MNTYFGPSTIAKGLVWFLKLKMSLDHLCKVISRRIQPFGLFGRIISRRKA